MIKEMLTHEIFWGSKTLTNSRDTRNLAHSLDTCRKV